MLVFTSDRLTPAAKSRRVLVVEEDRDAAEALHALLELHGHVVRVARGRAEGAAIAGEWRPEVVLTDTAFPLDGFTRAESLRSRVADLTGRADAEGLLRARDVGTDLGALLHLLEGLAAPQRRRPACALTSDRPALATAARPRRVLVVEDNADAALSLRRLLELRGHEVRVAHNGVEGIGLACEWKPDVVLSDLGLPKLDGFGVAAALRPSGVRLVAITGYGSAEVRTKALASGFVDVLVKPADPEILVRVLGVAS
jgi:CheY-like chemotaxis protein